MSEIWGDAATWTAAVIAVAAAGFSARTLRETRRAREAAQDSADSARKSAEADTKAVEIAQRALDLAEKQDAATAPPKVDWQIEYRKGSQYVLRNIGTDTATGVTVDESKFEARGSGIPSGATVAGGAGETFLLAGGMQARMPSELWVSWDGCQEPQIVPMP